MQVIKYIVLAIIAGIVVSGCTMDKPTVYSGNVELSSEASLDNYPDLSEVKKIEGNLKITQRDISSKIRSLTNLEEVTGDLIIDMDYGLRNEIVPELKTIGGDCTLNLGLSPFLDFSTFESIGGKLLVARGFVKDRENEGYDFSNLKQVKEILISTSTVRNYTFSPELKELDVFHVKEFRKNIKGLTGLEHVRDSLYIRDFIDGGASGSFSNLKTVGKSMDIRIDFESETAFKWLTKLESCPSIKLNYYYLYPYDLCGLKSFITKNPDTKYEFSSTTFSDFNEQSVLAACP